MNQPTFPAHPGITFTHRPHPAHCEDEPLCLLIPDEAELAAALLKDVNQVIHDPVALAPVCERRVNNGEPSSG